MKMKPVTVEATVRGEETEIEIHCRNEHMWPPIHAKLGASFEAQRAAGDIDDTKYQQLKVWQKVCGLFKMKPEKCLKCHLCETTFKTHHLSREKRVSIPDFKRVTQASIEGS